MKYENGDCRADPRTRVEADITFETKYLGTGTGLDELGSRPQTSSHTGNGLPVTLSILLDGCSNHTKRQD